MKEIIYVFPADLFERDEAKKWITESHYAPKLKELLADGRIKKYTVKQFCKDCNNREIFDMFQYWLVFKPQTKKRKLIGYQIISNDNKCNLPDGLFSFQVIKHKKDAINWINKNHVRKALYKIIPIFNGDIEGFSYTILKE